MSDLTKEAKAYRDSFFDNDHESHIMLTRLIEEIERLEARVETVRSAPLTPLAKYPRGAYIPPQHVEQCRYAMNVAVEAAIASATEWENDAAVPWYFKRLVHICTTARHMLAGLKESLERSDIVEEIERLEEGYEAIGRILGPEPFWSYHEAENPQHTDRDILAIDIWCVLKERVTLKKFLDRVQGLEDRVRALEAREQRIRGYVQQIADGKYDARESVRQIARHILAQFDAPFASEKDA